MKVLLIDNYDSFTYNLAQMVEQIIRKKVSIYKNDEISINDVEFFDHIILSPGPGLPKDAGIMLDLIKKYHTRKSILGVCLGHQAIAESFGAKLLQLPTVFHGVSSDAKTTYIHSKLLRNLPSINLVGRYHSWAVDPETLSKDITVTSVDENGTILSFEHKIYDLHGVQYHPESILTPKGKEILKNFLFE